MINLNDIVRLVRHCDEFVWSGKEYHDAYYEFLEYIDKLPNDLISKYYLFFGTANTDYCSIYTTGEIIVADFNIRSSERANFNRDLCLYSSDKKFCVPLRDLLTGITNPNKDILDLTDYELLQLQMTL